MDINTLFPSKYLKAADLQGQVRRVVIESFREEELGQRQREVKGVLQFEGVPHGLVLNKTNGLVLAAAFGNETNDWLGKTIELYPETVVFQGRMVPAIRVRIAHNGATPAVSSGPVFPAHPSSPSTARPAPPAPQPLAGNTASEHEHAAQASAPRQSPAPPTPAATVGGTSDDPTDTPFNDNIAW